MKHPIPDAALQQHIAVLGKTGSGKTSTAKLIVEYVVATGARVCVLDPIKSDWWGITSSADGKKPGLPFHILGGPHGHVGVHSGAGKAIGELVGAGKLPLSIIDMADLEAGGAQKFFVDFAPALLRSMRGVLYLVLEEAHEFAPKERAGFQQENMAIHFAKKLATAGRSRGLRLIVATQATQQLHNRVLGSCETMIVHRFTAPADQKPVIEWLKANTTRTEVDEVAGSLSRLVAGEAWVVSGEAQLFERRKFPRISTYDNSATPTADAHSHEVKTAPVDHDNLRLIIGEAVKEAEANDPAILRARIAQLEREAKKPAAAAAHSPPAPTADTRALNQRLAATRKALEAAMKFVATIKTVGFPAKVDAKKLEAAIAAAVERVGAQINADFEGQRRAFEKWQAEGEKVLANIDRLLGDQAIPVEVTVRHNEPFSVEAKPRSAPRAPTAPMEGISRSQQRILESLSLLESMGIGQPSRHQLALWAEVSPTSGGYFNNLGALRSGGLIDYPTGGTVALTDAGRERAPTPTPLSVSEMQDSLCAKVGSSKAAILRALIDIHPKDIARDDLAEKIDVSPTSGGYFNNLGALRTLGVIEYPSPGRVVALPVLFLD